MANKWIIAAATATLFCSVDWLAATRAPPASATPIAPVTTPVESPLAAARGNGRTETTTAVAAIMQAA